MPNMFSLKTEEWVLEREERSVSGAKRNGKRGHLRDCMKAEEEKKEEEEEEEKTVLSSGVNRRTTVFQATDGGRW